LRCQRRAGWRGGEGGGGELPDCRCKFGYDSLLLCFGVSLREICFKLVGHPAGKTAASIPRGAMQSHGYVNELKLVCFGDFKIHSGFSYFGIPGRLSSKRFSVTSMV